MRWSRNTALCMRDYANSSKPEAFADSSELPCSYESLFWPSRV